MLSVALLTLRPASLELHPLHTRWHARSRARAGSGVVPGMPALLAHPEAAVRARSANLLGNLCRHSPRFYADLGAHGVVPALIQLCRDPDRAARKFACFAIGNAGGG